PIHAQSTSTALSYSPPLPSLRLRRLHHASPAAPMSTPAAPASTPPPCPRRRPLHPPRRSGASTLHPHRRIRIHPAGPARPHRRPDLHASGLLPRRRSSAPIRSQPWRKHQGSAFARCPDALCRAPQFIGQLRHQYQTLVWIEQRAKWRSRCFSKTKIAAKWITVICSGMRLDCSLGNIVNCDL
ncbi:unnamed protein product, partial [Urochloa humidicola]